MNSTSADVPPPSRSPPLVFVLALFVGSGCAALIYEIVWFQLLQLVIGSSAVSLGVLLGTFMGGMCLGSLLLPRLISARRHPLRVYAALELAIGVIALAVLYGLPPLGRFYAAYVGTNSAGVWERSLISAICLLPPTMLMGATLPAVARWVENTPRGISWLGFFYGGNIAGAVIGCLLAGFYLLRVFDMPTATFVAVGINVTVAICGLTLAAFSPHRSAAKPQAASSVANPEIAFPHWANWPTVYVAIALSGMTALAGEVVWTRLLSLMLGATAYTFSIILAVFLVGLGIGSTVGASMARSRIEPRVALGICQLLLAGAIAWTAFMLTRSLPFWPIDLQWSYSPWFNFQLDLIRCAWAILLAACLWGASFPLALAAAAGPGDDPSRLVGSVYAANTVGAIIGALVTSVLLVRSIGTQGVQEAMIGASVLAAVVAIVPALWRRMEAMAVLAVGIVVVVWLAFHVPAVPWGLVAYGRWLPTYNLRPDIDGVLENPNAKCLYVGEGQTSSVAVTELTSSQVRNFHVSGKVEASTETQDMRLQRMLGHLPGMLHPHPQSVLIVGCGAGVTAGSFIMYPDVKRIVICEIEPLIPQVVTKYFAEQNYHVVGNPRVEIVFDDARHYLLRTHEKFDIITSDPIHPWVKGTATLYTQEYFELVRQHLNPGGFVTQWVPLYESNFAAVACELATFFKVFPHGTLWSNDLNGEGYDTVVMGQTDTTGETGDAPLHIDVAELQTRWLQFDRKLAARSLADVGFATPVDLLITYAGSGENLASWLKTAEINRDQNLRLQYLAGMGLNQAAGGEILNEILSFFRYPETEFVTTPEVRAKLEQAWSRDLHQKAEK